MGINKIKIAKHRSIRNQNSPCPFQAITFVSTMPVDSKSR
jgi:hypothetical protein